MKLGIVGLPNVGKSTLFNALTKAGAIAANFPFCTIDPNVGVVAVRDKRLDELAKLYNPEKYTPAIIEFVDIAGLVKGASKGEGLGNKFLSHIREVDAIVHVVRCFENDDIIHVDVGIDPERDVEVINMELILSDIELLQRRHDRLTKQLKGDKTVTDEVELIEYLIEELNKGSSARNLPVDEKQKEIVRTLDLLSGKPVIYVANVSEDSLTGNLEDNELYMKLKKIADREGAEIIAVCAELEAQIAQLDDEEQVMFLEEMGLKESGLERLVTASYRLLGLISYLTAGPKEVRAWTITKGTKAPQAAGKIHSDFERGFIRAEVVAYDDLIAKGSTAAAAAAGLIRSEGKEYVIKDGDVVLFRFNV
ncbi:MAG: redox-regulated ATPase YchF [Clostridiales bacterium GWF2_38_85]|nr:MAG: redox-regulated ATPase YchF [Clostridiales bacterium GWF2_38_85]HBL83636.1 redox-regulated ATPase YchF [Clostridiales bacterium]